MCNGRDDSCDGFVDNNPLDPEIGERCGTNTGRCSKGVIRCIHGELTCVGAIEPRPEECNGMDDDCDGIIDNNIPEEICYTGPPETRGVGICHAGIQRCVRGAFVCEHEQTPMPFDCTNGLDNNCDGSIDIEDDTDIDLVLFVDWSGSMVRTLSGVRNGLLRFAEAYRDSDRIRIATVVFPDAQNDGYCALLEDFVSPSEAIATLQSLQIQRVGIEPSYQCMYDAAIGLYDLDYRSDADVIFMLFTDEPNFNNDLTQEDVAEAMNELGATGHFFVDPLFQHHYDDIVEQTEGIMEDLEGEYLGDRVLSHLLSQTCSM